MRSPTMFDEVKEVDIEYLPGVKGDDGKVAPAWMVTGPYEMDSEMAPPLFAKDRDEAHREAQSRAKRFGATILEYQDGKWVDIAVEGVTDEP